MKGDIAVIAIDALDNLSRYRALTDAESLNLERLIRIQELSDAGRQRLHAWNGTRKRVRDPIEREMQHELRRQEHEMTRMARAQ